MFWTILFLLLSISAPIQPVAGPEPTCSACYPHTLSTFAPTQPVARSPVQTSDTNQVGKQFNPYGPATKPNCRPQVPGAKCVVE